MDQDLELINQFKSGKLEGFEMLVKKYYNRVINIIRSLTYDSHDAQDIAQEAFLKVYHQIDSFRNEAKFSSWLYRVTVNTAYDFLRRRKNNTVYLEDVDYERIVDQQDSGDILAKELVWDALKKVPFEFRSVLALREIEGLSYGEIAQALKIRIGTVESRLYRARQMLKNILAERGVFKDEM